MSRAQITFIRKTMATKTCKMIALFLKVIRSYMIPDTVGPQKLPRAKEEVNNPETTACTWWENESVQTDCNVKRLGWQLAPPCFQGSPLQLLQFGPSQNWQQGGQRSQNLRRRKKVKRQK